MAALKQFKLPDVGEGLTEAEILSWHVKPGDEVKDGQVIVEVETAKAAVELPSPFDGVVTELHVAEGDTVDVGTPILTVDTDPGGGPTEDLVPGPLTEERQAVLVGYGPKTTTAVRRARKAPAAPASTPAPTPADAPASAPALAKPPVRKLAKDLGVDLTALAGS